jgi:hypothetical protein
VKKKKKKEEEKMRQQTRRRWRRLQMSIDQVRVLEWSDEADA